MAKRDEKSVSEVRASVAAAQARWLEREPGELFELSDAEFVDFVISLRPSAVPKGRVPVFAGSLPGVLPQDMGQIFSHGLVELRPVAVGVIGEGEVDVLADCFSAVRRAEAEFMALPARIRALGENSAIRFRAMLATPAGRRYLAERGGVVLVVASTRDVIERPVVGAMAGQLVGWPL